MNLNDIDILAKCKPKPITPFMQCLVIFSLHLHSLNFAPKEWWFRILQAPFLVDHMDTYLAFLISPRLFGGDLLVITKQRCSPKFFKRLIYLADISLPKLPSGNSTSSY